MDYEAANGRDHSDDNGHQSATPSNNLTIPGLTGATAAGAIPLTAGPDGVIVLPAGVELDDILVQGRDLVIQTADGRTYIIVDGAVFVPTLVIDGVSVPPLNLAALLNGEEIVPAAGTLQSSGNNFADPVGDIQDAFPIGDLLPYTDFGREPERDDEIIPGFVNREPDTEIVTPNNPTGAVNATADVFEKGLPPHNPSLPAGSGEIADGNANNNSDTTETTSGTIIFQSPDGVQTLTLNGTSIVVNGAAVSPLPTIAGSFGTITITSVNIPAGEIGFTYTLTASTSGAGTHDDFAVRVVDPQGDIANATLVVNITDDGPIASPDTNTVTEGALLTVAASGVLGNDIPGADGYATGGGVVGVAAGSNVSQALSTGVNTSITGAYGTLILQANGSYTYKANPNTITSNVVDHFVYTIRDGDGSTSTTTLDITVNNVTLVGSNVTRTVDEAALDTSQDGSDLAPGSTTGRDGLGSTAETVTGTLVNAGAAANGYTPQSVTTAYGQFQLNANGTYTYTLINPVPSGAVAGPNQVNGVESFNYTFADAFGNTAGGTITVNVIDDVPSIDISDTPNTVVEGQSVNGTYALVPGADGVGSLDVTVGATTLNLSLANPANSVAFNVAQGVLTVRADGTWTFASALNQAQPVSLTFTVKATDGDLDVAMDSQTITITDGPGPQATKNAVIGVDEEGLATANATGSNPDALPPSENGSDTVSFTAGSDAITTVRFAQNISTLTADFNGVLGADIVWTRVSDTQITGSINGINAITITLTPPALPIAPNASGSATVSVVLSDNFPHPDALAQNVVTLTGLQVEALDTDLSNAFANVTINVTDDIPTATDDGSLANPFVIAENTPLDIPVLANDTFGADGQGSPAIIAFTQPAIGSVVLNANNTFTVTPPANGFGPASFTYTIKDADGDTSTATVYLDYARDSVPNILGPQNVVVDEDGFAYANDDTPTAQEIVSNELLINTGTVLVSFGADKPANPLDNIDFVNVASLNGQLSTVNGAVNFTVNPAGTTITGNDGTNNVIIISFTGAADTAIPGQVQYTYQVQLLQPILHDPANGETSKTLSSIQFTVVDSDGSSPAAPGSFNAIIFDDVPVNNNVTISAAVHEDALNNGNAVGNSAGEGAKTTSATFTLAQIQSLVSAGADRPAAIGFNSAIEGAATGLFLGGTSIVWDYVNATQVQGVVSGTSNVVFTLTRVGSNYNFQLVDNIDHSPLNAGDADTETLSLANVFTATDTDGDTVIINAGASITIENDVPVNNNNTITAAVHEDALNNGNAVGNSSGEGPKTTTAQFTLAQIQGLVTPGADGPVAISFNAAIQGVDTLLDSDGISILWHYVDATHLEGRAGANVIFTLTRNGSNFDFQLVDHIDNSPLDAGDNDTETLSLANVFIATDTDGDFVIINAGATITIENDEPKLVDAPYAVGTVHEDALTNTAPDYPGNAEAPPPTQTTTATILGTNLAAMVSDGADGPTVIGLNSALTGATGLEQGGVSINWHYVSATQMDGIVGADTSAVVFSIVKSGADWTFTLKDNIDNDNDADLTTGTSDVFTTTLSLANVFVATDTDGDFVLLSSGLSIAIENDVPIAMNDRTALNPYVIAEDTPLNIAVLDNDSFGADGPASPAIVGYTQPSIGSVVLELDGTFTVTPPPSVDGVFGPATFTYTIRDGDGDESTATVYLDFAADSEPNIGTPQNVTVDEDGFGYANLDNTRPGEIASNELLISTGKVLVGFGADKPGTPLANIDFINFTSLNGLLTTVNGAVNFTQPGGAGTPIIGNDGTNNVIVISFTAAADTLNVGEVEYTYQVQLLQPILHTAGGGEASKTLSGIQFQVEDSDGSTDTGSFNAIIFDDVPVNNNATISAAVHEDALNNGNAVGNNEGGKTTSAQFTVAQIQSLVSAGADTPVTIGFNAAIHGVDTTLDSDGVSILWHYVDATHLEGRAGANVIFTLTRNGSNYDFELVDHIDHLPLDAGDLDIETLSLANVFTATDKDGDTVIIDAGASITIENDEPVNNANTITAAVHEDALNNGNAVGNSSGEGAKTTSAQFTLAQIQGLVTPGADGPVAISFNAAIQGVDTLLDSDGVSILWHYVDATHLEGRAGSNVIFTLTRNGSNFDFQLVDHIDHSPLDAGDADTETLSLANVFIATDTDGDFVIIDGGATITIENDIPVNNSATAVRAVHEDALNNANAVGNNEGGKTTTASFSAASIAALVTAGADAPVTIGLNSALAGATGLTQNGVSITWDYVSTTQVRGLVNSDSTKVAFTLTWNGGTSSYDFVLLDNIDNDADNNLATGEGEAAFETLSLANVFTATDTDGDMIIINAGASVTIENDAPLPYITAPVATVHANTGTDYTTAPLSLNLPAIGADGPGTLAFTQTSGTVTGFIGGSITPSNLQALGSNLTWALKPGDATILQAKTGGGVVAFEIDLNPANGTYTFSQYEQITATINVDLVDLTNVGGGNVATKAINVAGIYDLAVSTTPGETVNTSSATMGVGGGQSMSNTDVIRIDFVTVASVSGSGGSAVPTYGEYYSVNTFKQDVTGLNNVQFADFTVKAITVVEASPPPNGPADGDLVFYGDTNDTFIINNTTLNIYGDDGANGTNGTLLASFDKTGAQTFAAANWGSLGITVAKLGDGSGWQIDNLRQGFDYEIGSSTAFQAVQVQSVPGSNTFKLGFIDINVLQVQGVAFSVPISWTDSDGDQVTNSIPINLSAPPIVFDLNGDGAKFLSLAAGVHFAYIGDPAATAWVDPNDGLLAIDLNGNRLVDDASELVYGGPGATDLQGLAANYDSNQDGMLDAQDGAWSKFGIWQDANSNGITDEGEFHSLGDLGIASISLTSDGISYTAADGDVTVHGTTTFTKVDGSTGTAADVSFALGDSHLMSALLDAHSQQTSSDTDVSAAVQGALVATIDELTVDTVVDHYAGADAAPQGSASSDADLVALLNSSVTSTIDMAPPPMVDSYDDHSALAAAAA